MDLKSIIQKMPRLLLATSYPHKHHRRGLLELFYLNMKMLETDPFFAFLNWKNRQSAKSFFKTSR